MTYLDELADKIRANVSAEAMPDGDTRSLFLNYAVLALAVGEQVTRRDVHNAWTAWMLAQDADHDSLVTFEALDAETQAEDDPFVRAIRDAVRAGS